MADGDDGERSETPAVAKGSSYEWLPPTVAALWRICEVCYKVVGWTLVLGAVMAAATATHSVVLLIISGVLALLLITTFALTVTHVSVGLMRARYHGELTDAPVSIAIAIASIFSIICAIEFTRYMNLIISHALK